MRTAGHVGCAAIALVALAGGVLAQETRPAGEEAVTLRDEETRVVVKRYVELSGENLLRAVVASRRVDVRFQDVFDSPRSLRASTRSITMGRRRYRIAAAFRTEGKICCLVSRADTIALEKLRDLKKGQIITVEGVIVGPIGLDKCVLVERILTGREQKSVIEHDLILGWPDVRGVEPIAIRQPGEHRVEFPCAWQKDAVERFTVLIERRQADVFLEELRRRADEEAAVAPEGERTAPTERQYLRTTPDAVYDMAREGAQEDVSFVDEFVRGLVPESPALGLLPRVGRRPLRIGYIFDVEGDLTCAIPRSDPILLERASRIVEGQSLVVKGTVYGSRGGFKVVVVHEIEFPDVKGQMETADVWVVRILRPDTEARMFYEVGTYGLVFPCGFVEGRAERMIAQLREVRVVKAPKEGAEAE